MCKSLPIYKTVEIKLSQKVVVCIGMEGWEITEFFANLFVVCEAGWLAGRLAGCVTPAMLLS